jgi:hypothetical protein
MRKILFTLLFLPSILLGQAPFPDDAEIKLFEASKTCVVLEDDPFSSYNVYIKQAANESWKITPFEFITVKEFNVRRLNPAYSFIVLTQTNFDADKSHGVYNFLNLLQGKNVNTLAQMPEICAIPLSFEGVNDFVYSYKLGTILAFVQNHAKMIIKDPTLTLRKYLKFYNKNIPDIKEKTILVTKDDLTPALRTIEKIKAIYTGSIRLVTDEEQVSAIDNKTPNTIIVHIVGPMGDRKSGYCFVMMIGIADSELYYYNLHLVDKSNPNGILPEDLKRLENQYATSGE